MPDPYRLVRRRAGAGVATLALLLAAGCGSAEPGADARATADPPRKSTPSAKKPSSPADPTALSPHGSGDPFADARTAAAHMPMTAASLAQAFGKVAGVEGSTTSDAAELRSGLTYLLTEHVYLAGIAVATTYAKGADSAEFKAAGSTLDANSRAVAAAVGSVAGPAKGKAFLASWRSHIQDFIDYAVAAKGDDAAGKQAAVDNLMAYARTAGEFFAEVTAGTLPAKAVQQEFEHHITSLAAAVDALAAGDATAYDKLAAAAAHMPMSADALATGIATAAKLEGDPSDPAADLRAALTAGLTTHVYLASVAVFTAYTVGADSEPFEAAAATLDANSVELAKAVGTLTGNKDTERTFLRAWRSHVDDFVSYAVAAAGKDEAGKRAALESLAGYTSAAGELISSITDGELGKDTVREDLVVHVESLAGAIDSLAGALAA